MLTTTVSLASMLKAANSLGNVRLYVDCCVLGLENEQGRGIVHIAQ
jgi:hypothetical protein